MPAAKPWIDRPLNQDGLADLRTRLDRMSDAELLKFYEAAGRNKEFHSMSAPRLNRRIPELDGLRGIAILLVLTWHYLALGFPKTSIGTWQAYTLAALQLSWSGVDLFFVLSGFLIGGILLDAKQSRNYFRTFYARRAFRILPLYFLWIALFIIGLHLTENLGEPMLHAMFNRAIPLWTYPLFLQNFAMVWRGDFGTVWLGMTWSLAIEEQFYLLLPLAVRRLKPLGVAILALIAICAALAFRFLLRFMGEQYFSLYALLPSRADDLGLGVLTACIYRNEEAWGWLKARRQYAFSAFMVAAFGFVLQLKYRNAPTLFIGGLTVIALFYAMLLLVTLLFAGGPATRILRSGLLVGYGTIAYGVYLFHQSVNVMLHFVTFRAWPQIGTAPSLALTLCSLAITTLLAALSWKAIESPLIRRAHARFHY